MGRPKGTTGKSSNNPQYALTAEKYSAMLRAYLSKPNITHAEIMELSGVGRPMLKRALTTGWPELNLPSIPQAATRLIEPNEVHKQMAAMEEQHAAIVDNIFGPEVAKEPATTDAVAEANRRSAESSMAARVSMSLAVKSAKAVEMLAAKILDKISKEDIQLSETVTASDLIGLIKMADTATSALHKALQTEKLQAGEPETISGTHITAMLVGATPEELRSVALTGHLPPRLLGIPEIAQPKIIDAELAKEPIQLETLEVESKEYNDPNLSPILVANVAEDHSV